MIAEIKNNSQHLLLSVGFLNLPPIAPSIVEKAIKENPEFEDILPQTTSDRIAFSKMRDEIDGFDTIKGRLLMNKGTKEDLAKWKCFSEEITEAFSILHTKTNAEGHDAETDGIIALSKNGNVLISPSAMALCIQYSLDPVALFEKHKGKVDALALRKAFTKFENKLSVKAIKLNNGTLLIHPSSKDFVSKYLDVLRSIGISEKFISCWTIFASTDITSLQNAYELHTSEFLQSLEDRLLSQENSRASTLLSEQAELKELLGILSDFKIPDSLISRFAKIDKLLDESLAKMIVKTDSEQNSAKSKTEKAKSLKAEKEMTTDFIVDRQCLVKLKSNDQPKILSVGKFSYNPQKKQISYTVSDFEISYSFFLDVESYTTLEISYDLSKDTNTEQNTDYCQVVNVIDVEKSTIMTDHVVIKAEQKSEADTLDEPLNDVLPTNDETKTTQDFNLYEKVDEEDIIKIVRPSDRKKNEIVEKVLENTPEISKPNFSFQDVCDWVIKQGKLGKPVKYIDAIKIYGQKPVDDAIASQQIFNQKGFLEEN